MTLALAELAFRGYLHPTTRDRLVNYYATDEVFEEIQLTITIAKSLPDYAQRIADIEKLLVYSESVEWYDGISEDVYSILQRKDTLIDTADVLSGKIITDYFDKVSDLVGGHSNLTWYARPEVVTPISELIDREENISTTTDFISGTTPAGSSRWSMLQVYLRDDTYGELLDLSGRQEDIAQLHEALSSKATEEGITFTTIADRLKWYSDGDVISPIGDILGDKPQLDDLLANKPQLDDILGSKPDLDELLSMKPGLLEIYGVRDRIQEAINGRFPELVIPTSRPDIPIRGSTYITFDEISGVMDLHIFWSTAFGWAAFSSYYRHS